MDSESTHNGGCNVGGGASGSSQGNRSNLPSWLRIGHVARSRDPNRQETKADWRLPKCPWRPRHPATLTGTREAMCHAGWRTLEWRKAAKPSTGSSPAEKQNQPSGLQIRDRGDSLHQSAVGNKLPLQMSGLPLLLPHLANLAASPLSMSNRKLRRRPQTTLWHQDPNQ